MPVYDAMLSRAWDKKDPEVTEVDIRHKPHSTYQTLTMKRRIVESRASTSVKDRELFYIKSVEISRTQVTPLIGCAEHTGTDIYQK